METRLEQYLVLEIQNLQSDSIDPSQLRATLILLLNQEDWTTGMRQVLKEHIDIALLKVDPQLLPLQSNTPGSPVQRMPTPQLLPEIAGVVRSLSGDSGL